MTPFPKLRAGIEAVSLLIGVATFARVARAQNPSLKSAGPGTLSGLVTDKAGRPIEDADVLLYQTQQRIRSRKDGAFVFDALTSGKYTIEARHLGYTMASSKVTVKDSGTVVVIKLPRTAFFLPSVVTTANRGGLSGTIADTGYKSIAGVQVQVIGGNMSTETDAGGNFFVPVTPGHYLVELKRSGFARQLVGVTIPEVEGRKIAAWMVPQEGNGNPMLGAMLFDLPQRLNLANPVWDKFFTREDLEKLGVADLRALGSVVSARMMNPDCPVMINGNKAHVVPLWSLTTEELEFVEVYTERPDVNLPGTHASAQDARVGGLPGGAQQQGAAAKLSDATRGADRRPKSTCGVALVAWLRN